MGYFLSPLMNVVTGVLIFREKLTRLNLIAIGFASLIAVQAVFHMSVGLALAPATGLALPLVSYGRSNLVITLAALGILISVARAAPGGKAARV